MICHCKWCQNKARTRPELKQPFGHGGSEGLLNLLLLQRSAGGFELRPGQITISDHHLEPLGITRYGHRVEAVGVCLGFALGVPAEVLEVVRGEIHIGIEGLLPADGLARIGGHASHDGGQR